MVTWELSPKPAAEYEAGELERLLQVWGTYKWAANAINVSQYAFRKACKTKGVSK